MKTPEWCLNLIGLLVLASFMLLPVDTAWSLEGDWTVYDTSNSGLPYNGVTAVALDREGVVWVGTGRWYAFAGGGLARFDGEEWTVYNTSNSPLPGNDHLNLAVDSEDRVWSGTETGLSAFDGQNWAVYRTSNSPLPDNQAGAPTFDAQGSAWIATGAGLAQFDGQNWTVYDYTNSGMPSGLVTGLAMDSQGVLWIGTFGSGLVRFDGQIWTRYHTGNSGLTNNSISFMATAPDGTLWMGTYGGGLIRLANDRWTTFNTSNSLLPNNMVWNVAVGPLGDVWAATEGGLAVFDGTDWTVYQRTNSGLPDNNVYCVTFGAQGNVWIGTANGGLVLFQPWRIVDFNGNGTVDTKDLLRLIESWGTNDPLCDVAPTAFGDGVVDAQDLEFLMSYWGRDVADGSLSVHWKLDETEGMIAVDSASDSDATLLGQPVWWSEAGAVGGALELDGATFATADPVLDPAEGPFSVLAWIQGGAPGQVILSQASGANWLMVDAMSGCLMTELKGTGRDAGTLSSEAVVTDGNWHRIALVFEDTERSLYVDDALVGRDRQAGGPASCEGGLNVGCGKDMSPGTFFTGLIDDVRIYDRAVRP
jgi:hypothetical protein